MTSEKCNISKVLEALRISQAEIEACHVREVAKHAADKMFAALNHNEFNLFMNMRKEITTAIMKPD